MLKTIPFVLSFADLKIIETESGHVSLKHYEKLNQLQQAQDLTKALQANSEETLIQYIYTKYIQYIFIQ